jgi:hypothetical protein
MSIIHDYVTREIRKHIDGCRSDVPGLKDHWERGYFEASMRELPQLLQEKTPKGDYLLVPAHVPPDNPDSPQFLIYGIPLVIGGNSDVSLKFKVKPPA